jgi:hypothetical protein
MTRELLRLPWRGRHVPHAVLDILRGCNIRCRACYNQLPPFAKPLQQIEQELDLLQQMRRLDSVAIAGGEPLLHPELPAVLRLVKSRGLSVELFSNGVGLSPDALHALKRAGLDLLFLHIDAHQTRPDLPDHGPAAVDDLRRRLFADAAAAGLEAGLAVTAYPDSPADTLTAMQFVLTSPHADYLLATLHRPSPAPSTLNGDLTCGMHSQPPDEPWLLAHRPSDMLDLQMLIWDRFALHPFAFIPSFADPGDVRWLTYLVGAVLSPTAPPVLRSLHASAAERLFLALHRVIKGRYPFFIPHSPARFRLQLLLSALSGGNAGGNLRLLLTAIRPGRPLRAKRLLLQLPARVDAGGRLVHCDHCPDATVRNGRLVPVCVVDDLAPISSENLS